MEEDWSNGENQTQEGTSKFIVLDSQEQVDEPQQDWPALQPPMAGSSEANNNQQPNKSRGLSLIGDLSEDERKLENAEVLVLDSEIEGTNFLHKQSLSNKGYRLPSDADEVISESEDQVNETVLERPPKGDGKSTSEDDENQTEASGSKTIHSSTGSGSSFHSNSRQGLGSYQHAEMSHTGLQGHRFRMFQETLSQDIFQEDQEDNRESSTPSEFIGSLQLSNQPMLVPETVDEEENAIPPSPTAYGNVPMIIPSSPTAGKTTDSDIYDLDEHEFNPAAESTFADNPSTRHSQSSEESGLYHDSSSGKSEEPDVTVKKVSPRSLHSDEGNKDVQPEKISTLITDDVETCGESLHLHYSATESHSNQQREESVEVVEVEEKKEDSVIIISFDEGTDQGDVTQKSLEEEGSEGTQSQDLVLHLTPSQYSKSQASQRGSNSSQKQNLTHSPALDPLSQENHDIGGNTEKDKSNTSNSDSAGFHLSLPKEGTLLHPVELSPGQNQPPSQTSLGQNQPPSQTSLGQNQPPSQTLSPHYPTPPPGPSHQGPYQDRACETRPVPAPSLTIDMIDTQTSMSEPGFTLHRPEMREIPSEQTEDSRFEVFRQKKGTGKLTRSPSKRQIINDGSDDECTPVGSGNKRTREETLSPRAESQQLPRLKKTRTLSSEATSTGYQASMEGMDTASPTEHMEVQEDVEDIMMQETESYDAGQTVQVMDVGDTSEQHHTQIKTCGVDAVGKDRQPFQKVAGNTHRQTIEDSGITSPKPPNVDMSIASEDLSHLERVKETIKQGHRRGKSKGKKSILKKQTEHDKEMTGISDRQKESGLQDPYIFHGSQSQMTSPTKSDKSPTKSDTVPLVPEADVGQDQTETSKQQPVPGSSKMETTPTTTRKKWNRAVHKKSGVKKAGPSQHVSFHNSVKNKSTPPRTETPKRSPKPRNRTSDSGPVDREVTRTPLAGQLAVRSPSVNLSTTVVTPITAQAMSVVQPTVSQSTTMAPPPAVTPVRTTPICQDLVVGPLSMTTSDSTIPPLPQETVVTKTVYRMWLLECKEITQTFRSPDGRVTRQTTKKEEDPPKLLKEVTTETTELLSVSDLSPSPSRSTSTMTSGDLADVSSSMSRSSSGSNRGSRQNLASLEGMGISQVNTEKSATDMDTYFTPPEPVSAPVRRTSALEKPTQTKPNETTRRSSTQPSDFEISPHVGELSTINKTGSDVMETSHLTEEKRHSESLFTSSTEDCEKLAEEKEKTDESEKAPGQVKDLGDISESSEGIPCGQTTVEDEAKSDVREPATSDTTSNDPHSSKRRKRSETSGSRSSEISPQISYQDPTLVRPDPALLCTPPTKGSAIKSETVIGARVLARWKDGFYYPGTISHILKSKYQVRFDDGDVRFVKVNDLLLIERLPIGQSVFVQDEGGYFEPGIITDHKSPMDTGQLNHYVVEQDNGTTAQFRCSQVILSDDQAQCLVIDLGSNVQKSPHGPPPTTPKTADISLDNLVDSKRRMSSRYEQQDLPNQKTRPKPTMDAPTTSTSHSSSSVKRKRGGTVTANPVATSTPTPAKTASSRLRTAVVGLDASPVGAAVSSPVTPRRSPRKARIGLFHGDRDARPRRKTTLFRGIVFLLTHVDKTKEQKEEDKKILEDSSLDVSTDESSSNVADEPTIPFDKNQLKVWIEDGGGIILEKYNEDEVSSARQCILLSDTYQRTVKYFQCLAAGLVCLSHVWVYDCYSEDQLLDHKAYILPSGISLEKRRLMEWKPTSNLLVNMKVMVESESDRFKEEWTAIIRIAGGEAETKIQTRNQRVNVILSDKTCPNSVVRRAKPLNIPVVSTEWMIQCLINSRLMAYDGHPKYRYDYNQS